MATLRVTAGTLRGRRIPVPPRDVRPTSERARQAFFNIIADRITGARFLDLFSGSGVFSFEALSRGAASAIAIDSSRRNIETINRLAKEYGVVVATITSDVLKAIPRLGDQKFDIVYADPPYDYAQYDQLITALDGKADFVAIEHRKGTSPFAVETKSLQLIRRAEYGEVWITLFENPSVILSREDGEGPPDSE